MRVPASHPLAQQALAQLRGGPKDRRGDRAFALIAGEKTPAPKRKNKYGAVRTKFDGIWFDSAHEARRWGVLKLMVRAGEIDQLERQVVFELGGDPLITYRADFRYRVIATGAVVVEDAKSEATAREKSYRLKKSLMASIHNIKIKEV
ncbi:DUF1064 domain-containing protein [Caulobacter sp. Root343]|uniref:DUF1064 domain-containing protein n=1 Tax=Caulobacter sp. Root343 TaxID=1736520 RepID=UPI0006F72A99|nr:DUF1064 domain-containing protein [Caulobacter sp. Root343]KQV66615.1 hypothetical protein ASC70_12335 [Caulobacter sp. Root343]